MDQEKITVPTIFRGLRILLLDGDTESLLHLASQLENYSYRVTTTELPTIALSILQERADRFDLIMADIEMQEIDCFKFIKSVQLIKDLPIILISAESKKNVIKEAMMKGACFFLKKPISSKNLKNVWQHFYRKTRKIEIKSSDYQEAESHGAKAERKEKVVTEEAPNESVNEHFGDSDQAGNDQDGVVGRMRLKNSRKKRSDEAGEVKRRKLDENQELADSPKFGVAFFKLPEETDCLDGHNLSEGSLTQSKFPTTAKKVEVNKKLDLATE
ncbi:two-component response regulator ARR10-like [Salvia miltiorrhiza]|uniref:two-component response regulator ARR10-like n=1 Tax=Salvia miltiorrhiza TaxID=226208 RepID=UPI0025AC4C92|nr:two-component response regulator ARR10-like [Salvia miltiorrhiza]